VLTNGSLISGKIIKLFAKAPPMSVEITLNGATPEMYEKITGVHGYYHKVLENVRSLRDLGIKVVLKTNVMRDNHRQVALVKKYADALLGESQPGSYCFRYDSLITPRLNGDLAPCAQRPTWRQEHEPLKHDCDMRREFEAGKETEIPPLRRSAEYLYRCNSWRRQFTITPFGELKICSASPAVIADLRETPFVQGYAAISRLESVKFKTDSKCRDCRLRTVCMTCPARAYIETGDQEAPVEFYCRAARRLAKQIASRKR